MNLNKQVYARLKVYGVKEHKTFEGSMSDAVVWLLMQLRVLPTRHNHAGHQPVQFVMGGSPDECDAFFDDDLRRAELLADSLERSLADAEARGEIPPAMSMLEAAIEAHAVKGANWNYEPYELTLDEVRAAGLPDYCAAGSQVTRPVKPL